MLKNIIFLLFTPLILVACDGSVFSKKEIVEAGGETYVIDQSTGEISIITDRTAMTPLVTASLADQAKELELDYEGTFGQTVVTLDLLITDDLTYWAGQIEPSSVIIIDQLPEIPLPDITFIKNKRPDFLSENSSALLAAEGIVFPDNGVYDVYETTEQADEFYKTWGENIRQSPNNVTFKLESILNEIVFGEYRLDASDFNVRVMNGDVIVGWNGNGTLSTAVDLDFLESTGRSDLVIVTAAGLLEIE